MRVIPTFERRNNPLMAQVGRQPLKNFRSPPKVIRFQAESSKRIISMCVEAGGNQNQLRLVRFESRNPVVLDG